MDQNVKKLEKFYKTIGRIELAQKILYFYYIKIAKKIEIFEIPKFYT